MGGRKHRTLVSQRETLVARAIVAYEIGLLRERSASTPLPRLTTDYIVEKYGLQWGQYLAKTNPITWRASRARQNVRNELNRAFRNHDLCKLRDNATGKKVREGTNVVFVRSGTMYSELRLLGKQGCHKEWAS